MNILFYIVTVIIVLAIQALQMFGNVEGLFFILRPVVAFLELFLSTTFTYYEGIGFISPDLHINISKACSGVNFFSMTFLMLVFSFISKLKGVKLKWLALIDFLVFSYLLTIFVNGSRIIVTVFVMNLGVFPARYEAIVHQTLGVFFYLGFLLLTHIIYTKLIKKLGETYEEII
ncbi:exosortase K [Alkaliphilus peptidifermentans]|uniref:Exosortase K n=1 Tax=Alkaliphilus peptidifermentans DSM 18978 TaxID=1120976 RepID=A0A1G5FUX3_9FIRM|nr:exosortase K [Alkaliphilus peptidifermentans]SCY42954.1 exosortase K [Alkaliphilus peptidifermentans DSM 18978]